MHSGSKPYFAAALLTILAGAVSAAPVVTDLGTLTNPSTLSGAFTNQAEVFEATFSLSSASQLTIFTTSYEAGGFQPMITLYTSAGNYVTGQQLSSPVAKTDPATNLALDQYLFDANVGPGNYIAVLTDWLNQQPPSANNLSDGFVSLGSGGSTFVDEQFNSRSANYALNLSATPIGSGSAVPEPATFGLILPALAGAVLLLRNKKKLSGGING